MGSDTYDDDGSPHRRPGLLKDQILLVKRKNSDRCEIAPIKTYLSFEKGFFIVIRACQLLAQSNDGIVLVGLAGPSGAGKTVFTEKILNFMPGVAVISMDNYNDSSRIVDGNYDDPRLTDYDALLKNIDELKNGTTANIPVYDFKSSSRVGYRTLEVPSSRIVIIEGIYALSERLRPLLDLRVSVEGGVHVDLVKRVLRDIQRAGQEPAAIIHQISETVYPMYKAFIEPDLQTAHIKISNKFNPFTGFQNPTYVLKSWKALSPDEIRSCFVSDSCVETSEQTYDIYLLPPGEDPESCQSYLRMRNKEGKYNLMFEEWVTDSPFVISPRISFEVSVRLLGGLMALGYTIAAILQRNSHIFSDDRISVKIDWLEQLNRQYIQVQGRERAVVKSVGDELGLEGSYIPRTYIEQIQLEKLMKEVMEVPEDLRTKLSLDEDVIGSPQDLFSRQFVASRYRHRGLNGSTTTRMNGYPDKNQQQQHHSENGHARGEKIVELSEQISTLNDRMDEFTYRIEEFSSKMVTSEGGVAPPKNHRHLKDDVCSNGSTSPAYLSLKIPKDVALSDEIMAIARGQRQIMHQLDGLCSLIKCDLGRRSTQQVGVETWSDFTGIRFPLVFTLAFGSLGILLVKGVLHRN